MTIRIAHLSDLHFGMKGHDEVWKSLATVLSAQPAPGAPDLRPDILIITGDIVDTPRRDWFERSAAEIRRISDQGIHCFVCPGNHDRHEQGNALEGFPQPVRKPAGWLRRIASRFSPRDDAGASSVSAADSVAAYFDQALGTFAVPTGAPKPIPLNSPTLPGLKWNIRILGIDSSADADFFARGQVMPDVLTRIRADAAARAGEETPDLVIALIHHHLLPITATETNQQHLDLARGTTVLNNAGSVLEALADCGVDLVLHGHEHARHFARYGSLHGRCGELLIIGAGSATGAHTGSGCDIREASFNLIELDDELRVSLREVRFGSGGWNVTGESVELLSASDIRRARYFRRRPAASAPQSRWLRNFEFTPTRDIFIREELTNVLIRDGTWNVSTSNTSGEPVFIGGRIEMASADAAAIALPAGRKMTAAADGSGTYSLSERLPGPQRGAIVARRIEHEILWMAGAVLCQDDLSRCLIRGAFRNDNQEFVATRVEQGIESLGMGVELPLGFTPSDGRFHVAVETPEGRLIYLKELQDRLRVTGRSKTRVSISVPFPLPGARYIIHWSPPEVAPISDAYARWRARLPELSKAALTILEQSLAVAGLGRSHRLGIYAPETPGGRLSFRLVGKHGGDGEQPPRVTPNKNENCFCLAHWGLPNFLPAKVAGEPDADELANGLAYGEAGMVVVPLFGPTLSVGEPVGVVRVGIVGGLPEADAQVLLPKVLAAVNSTAGVWLQLLEV